MHPVKCILTSKQDNSIAPKPHTARCARTPTTCESQCWSDGSVTGQPMIPATFLILVKTLPRIALVALLFAALAVGTDSMLVSPQH